MTNLGVGAGVRSGNQLDVAIGGDPDVTAEITRGRVTAVTNLGGGVVPPIATEKADSSVERSKLDLVGPANPVEIAEVVVPASGRHLCGGQAREELTATSADDDVSGVVTVGFPRPAVADKGNGPVAVAARHAEIAGGTNRDVAGIGTAGAASSMTDHGEGVVFEARIQRDIPGPGGHGDVALVPVDQVGIVRIVTVPSPMTQHGISLVLIPVLELNPDVHRSTVAGIFSVRSSARSGSRIHILVEGDRGSSLVGIHDGADRGSRRDGASAVPVEEVRRDIRICGQASVTVRIGESPDDGTTVETNGQHQAAGDHPVVHQVEVRSVSQVAGAVLVDRGVVAVGPGTVTV